VSEVVKFLIVVEETAGGFSAYSPDVPGCIATGATRAEVEQLMKEAVEFHLDGMREDGLAVPSPHAYATYVEVAA
jgi:predicted RNase H-like HicB family nuclease